MSGVKLRTKPPRNCTYLTWCEYCEESVHHEDGSCSQCASFDLTYFVKESDYEAVVKERDELKSVLEAVRSQMCWERDRDQLTMGFKDLHDDVTKVLGKDET